MNTHKKRVPNKLGTLRNQFKIKYIYYDLFVLALSLTITLDILSPDLPPVVKLCYQITTDWVFLSTKCIIYIKFLIVNRKMTN